MSWYLAKSYAPYSLLQYKVQHRATVINVPGHCTLVVCAGMLSPSSPALFDPKELELTQSLLRQNHRLARTRGVEWGFFAWDGEGKINNNDMGSQEGSRLRTVLAHSIHESRHSFWTEAVLGTAASRVDLLCINHRLLQCHSSFDWELTALFTLQSTWLRNWSKWAPTCQTESVHWAVVRCSQKAGKPNIIFFGTANFSVTCPEGLLSTD